ncbi:MAG: class I SAM-dependent methyltransferase [Candidatus Hydrogenedens sp.]
MDTMKEHFEEEAKEFDQIVLNLIPYYEEMIEALLSTIPHEKNMPVHVIDVGCGTGTIAKKVKEKFPNAKITCLDFAENMINMAKTKMADYRDISYILCDFSQFEFDKKYDVVLSSLSLHHLGRDKKQFYQKVFKNLTDGGVFYNADVVIGSNEYLEGLYMLNWKDFMARTISDEEINKKWLGRHHKGGNPEKLMSHLKWLEEVGFTDIDVIWKYYKYAVFGGTRKEK